MFVRYRYREPNGLIKLEAAPNEAHSPRSSLAADAPSSISFSLSLDSTPPPPCHPRAAVGAGGGRTECALVNPPSRSPISCISR